MNVYTRKLGNGYEIVGLEHAQILGGDWRNFSAQQRNYDSGNTRHFAVLVDEEHVEKLKAIGFNVGYYEPKSGDRPGYHFLDINLGWKLRDPNVNVISAGVKTRQNEETIGDLDHLNNIDYADIEVNPYHWSNNGRSGVKPWVSEMYIYLEAPSPIYRNFQQRTAGAETYQPAFPLAEEDENDIPF